MSKSQGIVRLIIAIMMFSYFSIHNVAYAQFDLAELGYINC